MKKSISLILLVLFLAGGPQVFAAQEEKSIDEIEENVNNMLKLLENLEEQETGDPNQNLEIPEETLAPETGEAMGAVLDNEAMEKPEAMMASEAVEETPEPAKEVPEENIVRNETPAPAKKMIEESNEVVRFVPSDPDLLFRLGLDQWKSKNLNGAIEQFEEVVRLEPENAHAFWNLGLIFKQKGQGQEAVDHMKKAEDLYLKYNYFSYAEETREHLDSLIKKYNLDPEQYKMASN